MGLCKCPKRRATNLFCFEHRVNVCEHCLVDVHESCVVQTYISWLTDSDYDPKCLLCTELLNTKETIRLKCLHNFHWSCLSSRINQMPSDTPATTYKCPSCLDTIFPSSNQTSPVIERLKQKLSTVNWGRVELGLDAKPGMEIVPESEGKPQRNASSFSIEMNNVPRPYENSHATSRVKQPLLSAPRTQAQMTNDVDTSDVKYVRRNAPWRLRVTNTPRLFKRIIFVLVIFGALYLLLILFGRDSVTDINPVFDPHSNPNIRVE